MKSINNIKTILLWIAAAAAITGTGCTQNETIVTQEPPSRTVKVSAALPQPSATRTLFADPTWNNTQGYGFGKVKWKAGDKISILCWQEGESWGKRINTHDHEGNLIPNGEIMHTLQSTEISAEGTQINFEFELPSGINSNKEINVLLTYLNDECNMYVPKMTDEDENVIMGECLIITKLSIDDESDWTDLEYLTRGMPMTLRGTIAKGASAGENKPLFSGTFTNPFTLFALDIENATTADINPRAIYLYLKDGESIVNEEFGTYLWDPIDDSKNYYHDVHAGETLLSIDKSCVKTIAPGKRFVYFVRTIIKEENPPKSLRIKYIDKNDTTPFPDTSWKTSSIELKRGKCYTLNLKVTDSNASNGIEWAPIPADKAPMQ